MPQHKSKFCGRFKTATSFCVCQFIGRTNFKIESYPFQNTESFQYLPIFQLFRRLNTRLCCSPLSRQPCFCHTYYAFTYPPSLRISICNAQAWCAEQFNYVRFWPASPQFSPHLRIPRQRCLRRRLGPYGS